MKRYDSTRAHIVDYGGYQFCGLSVAGTGTSITMPQLKVGFDTAQGLPHAYHMKTYLITHSHMDHAGGIPYILSQKALTQQQPGVFYMPSYMVEPMKTIMRTWASIEDYECAYDFRPVELEREYEINRQFFFKAFPTVHRVPSNGYTIFKRKKSLKSEYKSLPREELIKLRDQGQEINEYSASPEVSFTGDTKIEFLDGAEWVKKSKILFLEVTYGGEKKSVESAREWGHIHLDELILRLDEIESSHIVLIHQSSRYSKSEFKSFVDEQVPVQHRERIRIFPS